MADPMSEFQVKQLLISSISAIITFLAVLVALFKDWFWGKVKTPNLSAQFTMCPPFCVKTLVNAQGTQRPLEAYYFRIKITNDGSIPAIGAQIYVNELKRKFPDGNYHIESRFQPMNLKWAGPDSNNIKDNISTDILPGMSKYCNFGHIIDPSFRQFYTGTPGIFIPGDTDPFLFELELEVKPFTGGHLLKIGEYQISIKIAAENAKPIAKDILLNFIGPWTSVESTMFENAIGIRL